MSKIKLAVVIGRFQPFHHGHLKLVEAALEHAEKVLILVGSSNRPRSPKNPFTFTERKVIITTSLEHDGIVNGKVIIEPINDHLYNESRWEREVQSKIEEQVHVYDLKRSEVAIIGHSKDDSSYYINSFPQWGRIEVPNFARGLSATAIRSVMYNEGIIPTHVMTTEGRKCAHGIMCCNINEFSALINEVNYIKSENDKFKDYPYNNHLNCCAADALVTCRGHILMIERGGYPFNGCMAIVGGHKQSDETFLECALRELKEETQLKVPTKVLRGSIISEKLFDEPKRDPVITKPTMVYHFDINPDVDGSLPKVKGADDAIKAVWVPLSEVESIKVAFDHYDIISYFLGI